jgi:hypothetical protein
MTTVLLADRDGSAFGPLAPRVVPALLPLAGIPLLERALEALVAAGRRSALLVVGPGAAAIERRFGKGIRWGIALEIVRRDDGESAGDVLRRLEHRLDGETVVVRGDVGVHAAVSEFLAKVEDARGPVVEATLGGSPAGMWRLLPGALKKKDFPREPAAPGWTHDPDFAALPLEAGPVLVDGIASYRRADAEHAGGHTAFSERAHVDKGVTFEGSTTVGEDAAVLSGARLVNTSVLPGTAIPPGVTLENAVVSGNLVVDAATGRPSLLTDLLPARAGARGSGRVLGFAALALSLPLWPVAALWSAIANAGHATGPVTLAGNAPGGGRAPLTTFRFETAVPVLRDLPLLLAVVRGRLALTGVTPLTPAEESALSEAWEKTRDEAPAGLVSLARLAVPASAPPEVARVVDAFDARRPSPLLGRALGAFFSARAWTAPRVWNPDVLREEKS